MRTMHTTVPAVCRLALTIAVIAAAPMAGRTQPAGMRQASAPVLPALFSQPQLTGLEAVMAFARMSGTTPDFRPYAERSNIYTSATVFDRDAVLTREIARLEGEFWTFDLDKSYAMRVGVPVQQYAPDKGGYPLGFGETSRIGLSDPVNYQSYSLAFRNAAEMDFIPFADSAAARNFAQRNAFSTQLQQAGSAVLEIAYRLADAPPTVQGQNVIRADILAARLLSQTGQPIHDFGQTAASKTPVARNADGTSEQPVLKASDVQGFRIGMTAAEADALGTRGWKTLRGGPGADQALYFNNLAAAPPTWAVCADVVFGFPDQESYFTGTANPPAYSDCVAVKFAPGSAAQEVNARKVVSLVTQQHLPGTSPDALLAAVREKYGPPLYTRNNGTNLSWIGRDPAAANGPPMEIIADVRTGGDGGSHDVVLTIKENAYKNLRPKPVPASPAAAPKL